MLFKATAEVLNEFVHLVYFVGIALNLILFGSKLNFVAKLSVKVKLILIVGVILFSRVVSTFLGPTL